LVPNSGVLYNALGNYLCGPSRRFFKRPKSDRAEQGIGERKEAEQGQGDSRSEGDNQA
jgi:hypothetical protein